MSCLIPVSIGRASNEISAISFFIGPYGRSEKLRSMAQFMIRDALPGESHLLETKRYTVESFFHQEFVSGSSSDATKYLYSTLNSLTTNSNHRMNLGMTLNYFFGVHL